MQGIVFNAHYLAYCDDAFGAWVEAAMPGAMVFVGNDGSFDVVVKKAVVTWHGAAALRGDGRHRLLGRPMGTEQLRRRASGVGGRRRAVRRRRRPTSTSAPGTHAPAPVADGCQVGARRRVEVAALSASAASGRGDARRRRGARRGGRRASARRRPPSAASGPAAPAGMPGSSGHNAGLSAIQPAEVAVARPPRSRAATNCRRASAGR